MKKIYFVFLFIFLLIELPAYADYISESNSIQGLTNRAIENSRSSSEESENSKYIFLLGIPSVIIGARLARQRGRSTLRWAIICFFINIFGLILLWLLPSEPTPETHVLCPDCREFVQKDARVCKSCGCKLIPSG